MKMMQLFLAGVLCLATVSVRAQFGGMGGGGGAKGLSLSGSTAKLFGENKAFTATMELQANSPQGPVTVPGKVYYLEGKARFEMDLAETKSPALPPGAAAQMKSMGMDKMIVISHPEKQISYMIYPGLQAYVEMPLKDADADKPDSDFKIETTELAKEKLDGHDCVKNKAVVTDKEGNKHESTVWNATDLNKFPVKIEQTEDGNMSTLTFRDVKLSKPEEKKFDTPTDCKKYENIMAIMQEVMKRATAGAGAGETPKEGTPK
jgi:hypothetical protein